jgi:SecD/SecF fusion protein
MAHDTRIRFIAIVVLTLVLAYIVAPIPNKPAIPLLKDAKLNLGIDLAGGAELTYRVLFDTKAGVDTKALTATATDVIRNRIQQSGLKEPIIASRGDDQIVIQLAGVDRAGLNDYKKLIEQAGKLELFASSSRDLQERYKKDGQVPDGYRVWTHDQTLGGEYDVFKERMLLKKDAVITGQHMATAGHRQQLSVGHGMQWIVSFELKADGAKLFDEAAKILFNMTPHGLIAIVLDDKIISSPVVNAEHFGGSGIIEGSFDEKEARRLAIILRSGSLPAPIGRFGADGKAEPGRPEAESFVGPSLGQDAIRRGVISSGLTLVLVALFMAVYYRGAGLVAVVTLALNLIYLLGIMSFFGATLTLPGIAGIVLTVGMAVDANILIYERIREEQSRGKSASQAFEAGHERAFTAIVDSNITTLLAAVVLYYVGTGPVRGFAVTLSIGILTTLFSVLFCGKTFLRMQVLGGLTEFRMMKMMTAPNLDYLKPAKMLVGISALVVVAGTAFFLARGENNFGIDFRGGAMLTFGFNAEQDIDAVRTKIQGIPGPAGLPKYADASIQTVADPSADRSMGMFGSQMSRTFQLRTPLKKEEKGQDFIMDLRADIQNVFAGLLSHEPFEEMPETDVDRNPRFIQGGPGGRGWYVYVRDEAGWTLEKAREAISKALKDLSLEKDAEGKPAFVLEEIPQPAKGLHRLKLTLAKKDSEANGGERRREVREKIKTALKTELSQDPFSAEGMIGPNVAQELKNSSVWAMAISWVLMIVYIGFRFASWRYGVAAVLALVHDALIALAFTSVAGAVIPKSWGLSFDMNLTTMAAILTIIGFSINDTIVIFDRIRENLILMKKNTFAEVINTSVNQTMSRTILTSFTVWISCVVLYFFTMHTGGGIAEFSFPMIIGVLAGTYSTIYIASPVVLWWYKGARPPTA